MKNYITLNSQLLKANNAYNENTNEVRKILTMVNVDFVLFSNCPNK